MIRRRKEITPAPFTWQEYLVMKKYRLRAWERKTLSEVLATYGGSVSDMATAMDVDRQNLWFYLACKNVIRSGLRSKRKQT